MLRSHRSARGITLFELLTTLVLLYAVLLAVSGGWLFGAAVVVAGLFLVRQHRLVSPGDLSRVNAAFFTANGWLSVAVFVLGTADVLLR